MGRATAGMPIEVWAALLRSMVLQTFMSPRVIWTIPLALGMRSSAITGAPLRTRAAWTFR